MYLLLLALLCIFHPITSEQNLVDGRRSCFNTPRSILDNRSFLVRDFLGREKSHDVRLTATEYARRSVTRKSEVNRNVRQTLKYEHEAIRTQNDLPHHIDRFAHNRNTDESIVNRYRLRDSQYFRPQITTNIIDSRRNIITSNVDRSRRAVNRADIRKQVHRMRTFTEGRDFRAEASRTESRRDANSRGDSAFHLSNESIFFRQTRHINEHRIPNSIRNNIRIISGRSTERTSTSQQANPRSIQLKDHTRTDKQITIESRRKIVSQLSPTRGISLRRNNNENLRVTDNLRRESVRGEGDATRDRLFARKSEKRNLERNLQEVTRINHGTRQEQKNVNSIETNRRYFNGRERVILNIRNTIKNTDEQRNVYRENRMNTRAVYRSLSSDLLVLERDSVGGRKTYRESRNNRRNSQELRTRQEQAVTSYKDGQRKDEGIRSVARRDTRFDSNRMLRRSDREILELRVNDIANRRRRSERIFATENKNTATLNWQILFFAFQGIYICHIIWNMSADKTSAKKEKFFSWLTTNALKID
ncbi:uncharacterized protein LOC126965965 isoform X2 [Leptidea sinapis]|uniref:uncharacterized protein LOC126965965 isoform X2 n=1 Tax=Leptidea sinapis TaxID=189913 RepID=UPI0021C4C16C|nr:uncharacterized protein LOC126965965 isoform X2 [Leptidea sinapis]